MIPDSHLVLPAHRQMEELWIAYQNMPGSLNCFQPSGDAYLRDFVSTVQRFGQAEDVQKLAAWLDGYGRTDLMQAAL